MIEQNKGLIVSFEGISGSGKTYLINKLKESNAFQKQFFVKEVSDRSANSVDHKIINVITNQNNNFFQNGIPKCETFLLLALKIYDFESFIEEKVQQRFIVFEDRSIDTVSVYQSLILSNGIIDKAFKRAIEITEFAKTWRPLPDVTFYIKGDFKKFINRAAIRNNREWTYDEITLLKNADELYNTYAAHYSDRIVVINEGEAEIDKILSIIKEKIQGHDNR